MISVTVNSVDITNQISKGSLKIDNILTNKRDVCSFSMVQNSGKTYPELGQEVIAYLDADKVFGGIVTEVNTSIQNNNLIRYEVSCVDFTRLLDKKLVASTYTSMTVNDIIADIQTNFMPSGFTLTNVDCTTEIKYIAFNYLPISKCLEQLAQYTGFDWYVDADKDIHFFSVLDQTVALEVMDDNDTYIYNSLKINSDNSQVRNSIIVRGGEYLGNSYTESQLGNGNDLVYKLGFRYSGLAVTVDGVSKTIGVDNIDDPAGFDLLYNFQEKVLRFKTATKPASGKVINATGLPYLPVIVKLKSPVHIAEMIAQEGGDGIYEQLILDKSISSKEGARQRARAEINTYATTLSEGEFTTRTAGIKSGQRITVNSTSRDVNADYIVNRVSLSDYDKDNFIYRVSLITTKSYDLIDFLSKLLTDNTKTIVINKDEVIDLVESTEEEITLDEVFTASKVHNSILETITVTDSLTPQALNYAVEFVLGDYTPSGLKRQFILDGSFMS